MGLGSLSIGSFASYENTSSLVYFADLLRSVGGSMVTNAAGTALEDENAARRILRATPPAAGPHRATVTDLGGARDGFWMVWRWVLMVWGWVLKVS